MFGVWVFMRVIQKKKKCGGYQGADDGEDEECGGPAEKRVAVELEEPDIV